jgi:S1-C subfamily serine protease
MRLDSVRELKSILPKHLEQTFTAPTAALTSTAVARAASRQTRAPSYFLGISKRRAKGYCLAVRLQDHALERSPLVEEISKRARGEVDVRYVGQIRARAPATPWYRSKNRPLLIGSSVGFLGTGFIMAGTLGCFVRKGKSDSLYILSNNHVLADENRYKKGGTIVQPGELDGGRAPADAVAKLSAFIRLDPAKTNLVDCAIARLNGPVQANISKLTGIGKLAGVIARNLDVGDRVSKVGRTTGMRHGKVTAVELDGVAVGYDIGTITFDNQIEIEGTGARSFSDAGDSGSLIVDDDLLAAGLLFAGGDHGGSNGKGLTYGNPIDVVLSALKVKLAF